VFTTRCAVTITYAPVAERGASGEITATGTVHCADWCAAAIAVHARADGGYVNGSKFNQARSVIAGCATFSRVPKGVRQSYAHHRDNHARADASGDVNSPTDTGPAGAGTTSTLAAGGVVVGNGEPDGNTGAALGTADGLEAADGLGAGTGAGAAACEHPARKQLAATSSIQPAAAERWDPKRLEGDAARGPGTAATEAPVTSAPADRPAGTKNLYRPAPRAPIVMSARGMRAASVGADRFHRLPS